MLTPYTGELAGLTAAFLWAIASLLFRQLGTTLPPLTLNFYKGILSIGLLLLVLVLRADPTMAMSTQGLILLLISGVIGIGIGDTCFFAALNRLGEQRTVLMAETLAPPLTTLFAFVTLAELPPVLSAVGMIITITGVAWVIVERTSTPTPGSSPVAGILFGLGATTCQAVGAVLSRAALTQADIDPLVSALLRIVGGVGILVIALPMAREPYYSQHFNSAKLWGMVTLATVLGTFLGISFQQLALKFANAGVAQTLFATSSLFVLPLTALRGESLTLRTSLGALIAVGGIALLFIEV